MAPTNDPEMRRIGTSLKHRRLASGLTQAELAQAAGIGLRDVQRYESGVTAPGAPAYMRVLDALGLRVEEVDAPRSVNAELAALRAEVAKLSAQLNAQQGVAAIFDAITLYAQSTDPLPAEVHEAAARHAAVLRASAEESLLLADLVEDQTRAGSLPVRRSAQ